MQPNPKQSPQLSADLNFGAPGGIFLRLFAVLFVIVFCIFGMVMAVWVWLSP